MIFTSAKAKNEAIEILRGYSGTNPYYLMLKRDIILKGDIKQLNAFNVEYIIQNQNFTPKQIGKTIKIADWYGLKKQQDWGTEFIPQKLRVVSLLGETSTTYHCYVQYRKSIDPVMAFLPKRAVLTNFTLPDWHDYPVDFERYDKLSMSKDPNRRLKLHQKDGVKFLLSRKKCILADDMGYGKTCELAVAAIEGNFDAVLIICPASIKTNWKKELMWYVPERDITIIESYLDKNKGELERYLGYKEDKSGLSLAELQNEAKEAGKWGENRFVIVNYDIVNEFYEIPVTRSKENIEKAYKNSPMLQYIANKKALVIVDEAHRLSNTTADRYKIIKDLIKRGNPDSVYLATGTPITNNPQNYFNLLQLIGDPVADDREYYMKRYCAAIEIPKNAKEKAKRDAISRKFIANRGKSNWYELTDNEKDELREIVKKSVRMLTIPNGESNLEELKDRTAHIYLRRVKEDLLDLPNKTVHELFYDLDMGQIMEYNRLWEEYEAAQLEADPTKDLNKELLEGAIYRKYLSNQMVPNTIKLADSFIEKGEKVVIACCYDEELYTLKEYYGDRCVIYNGKVSAKDKDKNIEKFTNDPNIMVFIGNIQAAGVGITLLASHVLIFNNISFVPGDNLQMQDRIYRIGQTKDVDIYYQIFRDTQYEKMWNIVLRKSLVINQIVKKEDEK
jgi:SWI/SNF-related matrix-associated actin-dependent regulator 1 of chromatin subfamily A